MRFTLYDEYLNQYDGFTWTYSTVVHHHDIYAPDCGVSSTQCIYIYLYMDAIASGLCRLSIQLSSPTELLEPSPVKTLIPSSSFEILGAS